MVSKRIFCVIFFAVTFLTASLSLYKASKSAGSATSSGVQEWVNKCYTDYSSHDGWSAVGNPYFEVLETSRFSCSSLLKKKDVIQISLDEARKWSGKPMSAKGKKIWLVRGLFLTNQKFQKMRPAKKLKVLIRKNELAVVYFDIGHEKVEHKYPIIVLLDKRPQKVYVETSSFG